MDGFDLLILGFMLSAISADLNLTPAQSGSLVTWTLIGAVAVSYTHLDVYKRQIFSFVSCLRFSVAP